LPVAAKHAATRGFDAIVALGVVIRGGTPHFDYVCTAATTGLTAVALHTGVPVGFGVLTCDDEQQAIARAGLSGSSEDKGWDAAAAAIATALSLRAMPACPTRTSAWNLGKLRAVRVPRRSGRRGPGPI
jgi:6,7-dimethyl-8-ribityllumazine synthase